MLQQRPNRRNAQQHAQPDPGAGKPHNWPFGTLTEQQIRARSRQEAALRAGRVAKWPEALL